MSAPPAGTYTVCCSIPGHEAAGIVTDLVVAGDGAVATAEHAGGDMTGAASPAAMQAEMEQLMKDSLSAFAAETEGDGAAPRSWSRPCSRTAPSCSS